MIDPTAYHQSGYTSYPPPPPHPSTSSGQVVGYFTEKGIDQAVQTSGASSTSKEDLVDITEYAKEFSNVRFLNREDCEFTKPAYYNSSSVTDISKKGSVCVEEITIVDNLRHSEFAELLQILSFSKHLLFSSAELNRKEEKKKRKLLALLVNLNWKVRDPILQARLIKPMDERVKLLKNYIQAEGD